MTATVSIALATYNGERFLPQQLESLAKQTVLPAELVVCDDGSTDRTLQILEQFAASAPFPVRIECNQGNLGYQANFMKAAGLCTSDYIAFCDQDDVWLPIKLETCLRAFAHADVLCAYHNATVTDDTLTPVGDLEKDAAPLPFNPPRGMDPWKFGLGFTQIFHRSLLTQMPLWPDSRDFYDASKHEAHDQFFFFLAGSIARIAYIEQPLALYRRHGENITAMHSNSGLARKWKNLVTTNLQGIRWRREAAEHRARVLEKAAPSLTQAQQREAALSAEQYYRFSAIYSQRELIYLHPSFFKRMGGCLWLILSGCYRSRAKWGVGFGALVRDVVCGVLLPPVRRS